MKKTYDIKPPRNKIIVKAVASSKIYNETNFEAQRIIDLKIRKLYWDWNDNKIKQCRHINVVSVKE